MAVFLYGAAVQGIQSFILQTNKLKEIAGASELVSQVCSQLFVKLLGKDLSGEKLEDEMRNDPNFILHAAGNIRYLFHDENLCKKITLEFPRAAMLAAPGIIVSQAVVRVEGDFKSAVDTLEARLRIQKNRQFRSATLGMAGFRKSRHTGLPVTHIIKDDYVDESTFRKISAMDSPSLIEKATGFTPEKRQIANEIDKLSNDKSFIAVIHIDGNGLGSIVQRIGDKPEEFKLFSEKLNDATVSAARIAYNTIRTRSTYDGIIQIRPIVLGGDDLTVICNADFALDYAVSYIQAFEQQTTGFFKPGEIFTEGEIQDRMTACAGIAFVKSSFPYYYAYRLAEQLCSRAKKDAKDKESIRRGKELPPSCLLFHKMQDTFAESYDDIVRRELTPSPDLSFNFGPYYLKPKPYRWTVHQLVLLTSDLQKEENSAVKNTIRKWLSELYTDPGAARQMLQRARLLLKDNQDSCRLLETATAVERKATPAYDILSLISL